MGVGASDGIRAHEDPSRRRRAYLPPVREVGIGVNPLKGAAGCVAGTVVGTGVRVGEGTLVTAGRGVEVWVAGVKAAGPVVADRPGPVADASAEPIAAKSEGGALTRAGGSAVAPN